MKAVGSRKFQLGVMLATALSVSMWSAASHAYTPEQQQACTGDAMRLCGAFIPDVDRITVCMVQNKSQLSPGCRAHFRAPPSSEVTSVNAGKPLSIKPVTQQKPASAKAKKPKKPAKPDAT
jgi:hypothetical protein